MTSTGTFRFEEATIDRQGIGRKQVRVLTADVHELREGGPGLRRVLGDVVSDGG